MKITVDATIYDIFLYLFIACVTPRIGMVHDQLYRVERPLCLLDRGPTRKYVVLNRGSVKN